MKPIELLAAIALGTSPIAHAAGGHDHGTDHKPAHGGLVVESHHLDFELVVKPEALQLFVRDHGKPVDVSKATGKLTLLSGNEKLELPLTPAGDHLASKGNYTLQAGRPVIAQVVFPGKASVAARFVLR
ncbi:MAG: hypothetical protein AW08_02114 [Candidatus Accumulibacter adjunctus]|mgnify:FL=1|uniref:Uncharacterized protein n=1 Tax=Candidatus Accumulibacter adjunctus TaxID=1454001 RepID=A0A011PLS5_9PROT|nr:MAG: hypothetical protein AW08_02114 [Candidatus Accumulibacter adjunctus]